MPKYDTTIVRAVGNLLSGHPTILHLETPELRDEIIARAVKVVREIIVEVIRTEPISNSTGLGDGQ